MGRLALLMRLTRRGLRRHIGECGLLAGALAVAAASLTLGLTLHGATAAPYAHTRALTRGPDVVASVVPEPGRSMTVGQRARFTALLHDPDVARSSGPFPTTWAPLTAGAINAGAEVQGRGRGPASVDQPRITAGTWIRPHSAVLEQAFADALGAHVGTVVRIGGRPFRVAGIGVTAAMTPYPSVCFLGCALATPALAATEPGLVWLTRSDVRSLATRKEPTALSASLALRPGIDADEFVAAHTRGASPATQLLTSWRDIENHDDKLLRNERSILVLGGTLLALLAIATITVMVGARLAHETRRMGTLKALGATPGFLAATLLLQYLAIGVVATAGGVLLAALIAPHLDAPSAGLLGAAGGTSIGVATVAVVLAIVLGLTALATAGASLRAARASTMSALTESTHGPRRRRRLVAVSARLPAAGLLGLRLVARRPRRSVAAAAGVAVAVCGIVVVVLASARLGAEHDHLAGGLADPNTTRLDHVMFTVTVLLGVLSIVNVVFVAAATAADAQTSLAVVQALGAPPGTRLGALATALALPAALGAAVGLPTGLGLYTVLNNSNATSATPVLALVAVAPATIAVAAVLAAATARRMSRPPAEVLQTART